jgi:hypothetical protein
MTFIGFCHLKSPHALWGNEEIIEKTKLSRGIFQKKLSKVRGLLKFSEENYKKIEKKKLGC